MELDMSKKQTQVLRRCIQNTIFADQPDKAYKFLKYKFSKEDLDILRHLHTVFEGKEKD